MCIPYMRSREMRGMVDLYPLLWQQRNALAAEDIVSPTSVAENTSPTLIAETWDVWEHVCVAYWHQRPWTCR